MATKKTKKVERQMLSREGEVTDWHAEIFALAFDADVLTKERRSVPSINIRGSFSEAAKGVTQFDIMLTPGKPHIGNAEIPCIGSISLKTTIQGYVTLTPLEYQTALAMATTGTLRYISCEFQAPRYGSALIASITLASRKPSD